MEFVFKTGPATDDAQTENLLSDGAALAYGSKSKQHGDTAVGYLTRSNQILNPISAQDSDIKIERLAEALALQNKALEELRMQLGSAVSICVATGLRIERDR